MLRSLLLDDRSNVGPKIRLVRILFAQMLGKSLWIDVPSGLIPVGVLSGITASRVHKGSPPDLGGRQGIVPVGEGPDLLGGIVGKGGGAPDKSHAPEEPPLGGLVSLVSGVFHALVPGPEVIGRPFGMRIVGSWLDVPQEFPADLGGEVFEGLCLGRHACLGVFLFYYGGTALKRL